MARRIPAPTPLPYLDPRRGRVNPRHRVPRGNASGFHCLIDPPHHSPPRHRLPPRSGGIFPFRVRHIQIKPPPPARRDGLIDREIHRIFPHSAPLEDFSATPDLHPQRRASPRASIVHDADRGLREIHQGQGGLGKPDPVHHQRYPGARRAWGRVPVRAAAGKKHSRPGKMEKRPPLHALNLPPDFPSRQSREELFPGRAGGPVVDRPPAIVRGGQQIRRGHGCGAWPADPARRRPAGRSRAPARARGPRPDW